MDCVGGAYEEIAGAENALFLLAGAMLLSVAYATRRTMLAAKASTTRH